MNAEARQYENTITTPQELSSFLETLILKAKKEGVLDFSKCKFDVELDLVEILLKCGQQKIPNANKNPSTYSIECPFIIRAEDAYFTGLKLNTEEQWEVIKDNSTQEPIKIYSPSIDPQDTNIRFLKYVNFSRSYFDGGLYFTKSYFERMVQLNSIKVQNGLLHFNQVKFNNLVSLLFPQVHEGQIEFILTEFHWQAVFYGCCFAQEVKFNSIKVHKDAHLQFMEMKVVGSYHISPVLLDGIISFDKPTFESDKSLVTLDFEHCSPDSQGSVAFQGIEVDADRVCLKIRNLKEDSNLKVHFQDCGFYGKNVAFTNVDMQQVSVEGGNDISGMAFYRCQWEQDYPELWFNRCGWLAFRAFKGLDLEANTQKIADAYAQLKVRVLEAGDAQLSNDFHFWHQFYQRQKKLWNPFYLCTSAYGLSACLPSFWFGVAFLVFSLIYMWNLHCFTESNLVSLSASVPFVFNDVEVIKDKVELIATQEHGWFYPLYILQHLVQGYLLFQIGAAIRNKVKR